MSELSENLLNGKWQRLLNVKRYQTYHVVDPLTVADHCWLTAMISMIIFDSFFIDRNSINDDETVDRLDMRNDLLTKALLHDIEESLTGDIPREEIIRDEIKEMKEKVGNSILNNIFSNDLVRKYTYIFHIAKDHTLSGIIITYADMLSALIEALREKSIGNNNLDDTVEHAMGLLSKQTSTIISSDEIIIDFVIFLTKLTDEIITYIELTYGIRLRIMV